MSSPPTEIDYEQLQQDAMRGVVRAVLRQIAEAGRLAGDHHFYISFMTQAPGVILSKRLREKYPQEMTIVLQHRFWDLIVSDVRFEVKLTFDGIPERLVVPFTAIKVFIDPSVNFGMQFDDTVADSEPMTPLHSLTLDAAFDSMGEANLDTAKRTVVKRPRATRKSKTTKTATLKKTDAARSDDDDKNAEATQENADDGDEHATVEADNADTAPDEASEAGRTENVVSLDAFRKKTT